MSGSLFNKLREDDNRAKNESWEGHWPGGSNGLVVSAQCASGHEWCVGPVVVQCCLAGLVAEEVTLSVRERSNDTKIG